MAATAASLHTAMQFVRDGALEANLPERRIGELELLTEEVFMNVCLHAYPDGTQGPVTITYSIPAQGGLSVEVADEGTEFNPLTAAPPDLNLALENRPIGGLGLFLLKRFGNSLSYRRECGRNRLTFGISASS